MHDHGCNSDPTASEQLPAPHSPALVDEPIDNSNIITSGSPEQKEQQQGQQQSPQRTWESRVQKKCEDLRQLFDLPEGEVYAHKPIHM